MRRGGNTERDRDQKFENGCDESNGEGNAHMLLDDVDDWDTVLEAGSEIEAAERAEPVDVALENSPKTIVLQTVELLHSGNGFLGNRCATLVHSGDLIVDKADGHTSDQHVDDQGDTDQDKDR